MIDVMKILISCFVAVLGFLPQGLAQSSTQVDYAAQLGQKTVALLPSGTPVANGNSVWLGGFNSGFDPAANDSNPVQLLANWNSYDATTIVTLQPPFNQAGSFSHTGTSTLPVFNNMKIYLWIFSTDDGLAPEAGFANVNAYGLFSSSLPAWTFPTLGSSFPANTTAIYSSDVNQARHGSIDSSHLYLSTFSPVPEPSTVALLSIGIPAALLAFRRRR
jgi:hypothetical protein